MLLYRQGDLAEDMTTTRGINTNSEFSKVPASQGRSSIRARVLRLYWTAEQAESLKLLKIDYNLYAPMQQAQVAFVKGKKCILFTVSSRSRT
jgi:uncharacterized beta-barrel protein YwiB (DUF1934 family)